MKNSQENFKDKINELVNLYKQRKFSEVFETAKILIKDHPESFVIWNLLGVASKGLGRIDDSIKSLKKVIELNPEYADGYNNLGVILQEKGQLDESIECFNKALSLKPNYTQAFNNAAIAINIVIDNPCLNVLVTPKNIGQDKIINVIKVV